MVAAGAVSTCWATTGAGAGSTTGAGATATSGWRTMTAVRTGSVRPGTPVSPIEVMCVLCWPAPSAGLAMYGLGGTPWATATPIAATADRPAIRPTTLVVADMLRLLEDRVEKTSRQIRGSE